MTKHPQEAIDFYKSGHHEQYPEKTEMVYSNWTARSSKWSNLPEDSRDGVVFFGLQYFIMKHIMEDWQDNFFNRAIEDVIDEYKSLMDDCLGHNHDVSNIRALHNLGYLPIAIRALPEGTVVPYGVPMMTIQNTIPEFYWVTNYLETVLSCMLWRPCTSATTARYYRKLIEKYSDVTCSTNDLVMWQGHDFSMRGMGGIEDAAISSAAHLTSFYGTDTVPSIRLLMDYYYGDQEDIIGGSVPATEHSVMSMGSHDGEFETFKRLITEIYPTGIVSIVSDTWDLWKVLTDYMPRLKKEILARDGKVVIRPDSGDPVDIICGNRETDNVNEYEGVIKLLLKTFGGEKNNKGFIELNPKVGAIYGDSITPERCERILERLRATGIASNCIVFGIGSFTYAYTTRDTHGFAMKATAGAIDGNFVKIYKDPVTDDGTKKSLTGMVNVFKCEDDVLTVQDGLDSENPDSLLNLVFKDGELLETVSLGSIRQRIKEN